MSFRKTSGSSASDRYHAILGINKENSHHAANKQKSKDRSKLNKSTSHREKSHTRNQSTERKHKRREFDMIDLTERGNRRDHDLSYNKHDLSEYPTQSVCHSVRMYEETENEAKNVTKVIEQEKNILIHEFKNLSSKLKKLKDVGSDLRGRTYTSESTGDKHNIEMTREVLQKIDNLNEKYNILSQNLKSYKDIPVSMDRRNSIDSVKAELDKKSKFMVELESQIEQVQDQIKRNEDILRAKKNEISQVIDIVDNKSILVSRQEQFMDVTQMKDNVSKREKELQRKQDELNRAIKAFNLEKESFVNKQIESEQVLKRQEKDLLELKKNLYCFKNELDHREVEIEERRLKLEANERDFETLTKKLEEQSEELMNQKIEYNKKVEIFNRNFEKLQKEKEEFHLHEKDFHQKNMDLNNEREKLGHLRESIFDEKDQLEEKYKQYYKDVAIVKADKEHLLGLQSEINLKQKALDERWRSLEEEILNMNNEKEDFRHTIEDAENKLIKRQEELDQKEILLNERKEFYDDFDLKLLGIKMNEEVWQKRRDIEVDSLMDEIKRIKGKEKELQKREDKLNKLEQELKQRSNLSIEKTTECQFDISIDNDKTLLPLSGRNTARERDYNNNY